MQIYFNEQGQLIFDGCDCGERVKECWGDFDYEYQYTIEPDEAARLFTIFGVDSQDKHALLQAIQQRFSINEAYSKFGEFLESIISYSADLPGYRNGFD